jgi:hypothetical protein
LCHKLKTKPMIPIGNAGYPEWECGGIPCLVRGERV